MRFVPAAITPLQFKDIFKALLIPIKGNGIEEFEHEIASYFCAKKAFSFTSLMRTNYACLFSLGKFDRRREVILPRYSCPSFVHAILAAGLKVKYCDVNPETLSYKTELLFQIASSDTLAIICPNLFGLTNPIDSIMEFCRANNIFLIEGVDYGIGTEYKGRRIGTFGDFTILNFQEGKAIPVGGGMFTTNNENIISFFEKDRKKNISNILLMLAYSTLSRPHMYYIFMKITKWLNLNRKQFSMEDTIRKTNQEFDFNFDSDSYDNSLSNFQGALGSIVLSKLEIHIETRALNASILETQLSNIRGLQLIKKETGVNKVHYIRYPVLIERNKKDKVLQQLLERGIEASPMYIEHGMNISSDEYPGAERVANELLTLPCHPYTNEKDIEVIIDTIRSICN